MVGRLLELLETPRTPEALSRALGVAQADLLPLLRLLEGRGYLERLEACGSCGACSLKAFCQGPGQVAYRRMNPDIHM
jgi:DNA-binding IclR family transcriptional regulator